MKPTQKYIFIVFFFSSIHLTYSQTQSVFDKALSDISLELIEKLKQHDKKNVVILYITDAEKQITNTGKYLADMISTAIVNSPDRFLVFDRSNLNEILEAKKLSAEGYVDATKAQQLAQVLGVDAFVVGNYTLLTNTIKLTLKVLDSGNSLLIAALMKDLPLTPDAGVLLGITVVPDSGSYGHMNPSSESTGRVSKNPNCKKNNTGDYCFQNATMYKIILQFYSPPGKGYFQQNANIEPGQKQIFYDVPVGSYVYTVMRASNQYSTRSNSSDNGYIKGNVFVEECQEKVYVIR